MRKYLPIFFACCISATAQLGSTKTLINAALHGWEYEIKAGFNIGGTLPVPFPAEIRSIDAYNPTFPSQLKAI